MSRRTPGSTASACSAPACADWPSAAPCCAASGLRTARRPCCRRRRSLPAAERRRASRVVKLALARRPRGRRRRRAPTPRTLATVFTASGGDGHNCHALCETLASADRQMSPTRFHNSVHNAAAGYWGIATRRDGAVASPVRLRRQLRRRPAGGAGAGRASTASRCCWSPTTRPTRSRCTRSAPVPDAFGVALLLAPQRGAGSLARIAVGARPTAAPRRMADAALEALRADDPGRCARLPLLQRLARGAAGARRRSTTCAPTAARRGSSA